MGGGEGKREKASKKEWKIGKRKESAEKNGSRLYQI
jgi:hypothetical protein